jgi:DNA-binding CsgD family transcriptional regulator
MDIRQLLQLKLGGHSNRKIAALTGIHRNSVNAYVLELKACEKPFDDLLS